MGEWSIDVADRSVLDPGKLSARGGDYVPHRRVPDARAVCLKLCDTGAYVTAGDHDPSLDHSIHFLVACKQGDVVYAMGFNLLVAESGL